MKSPSENNKKASTKKSPTRGASHLQFLASSPTVDQLVKPCQGLEDVPPLIKSPRKRASAYVQQQMPTSAQWTCQISSVSAQSDISDEDKGTPQLGQKIEVKREKDDGTSEEEHCKAFEKGHLVEQSAPREVPKDVKYFPPVDSRSVGHAESISSCGRLNYQGSSDEQNSGQVLRRSPRKRCASAQVIDLVAKTKPPLTEVKSETNSTQMPGSEPPLSSGSQHMEPKSTKVCSESGQDSLTLLPSSPTVEELCSWPSGSPSKISRDYQDTTFVNKNQQGRLVNLKRTLGKRKGSDEDSGTETKRNRCILEEHSANEIGRKKKESENVVRQAPETSCSFSFATHQPPETPSNAVELETSGPLHLTSTCPASRDSIQAAPDTSTEPMRIESPDTEGKPACITGRWSSTEELVSLVMEACGGPVNMDEATQNEEDESVREGGPSRADLTQVAPEVLEGGEKGNQKSKGVVKARRKMVRRRKLFGQGKKKPANVRKDPTKCDEKTDGSSMANNCVGGEICAAKLKSYRQNQTGIAKSVSSRKLSKTRKNNSQDSADSTYKDYTASDSSLPSSSNASSMLLKEHNAVESGCTTARSIKGPSASLHRRVLNAHKKKSVQKIRKPAPTRGRSRATSKFPDVSALFEDPLDTLAECPVAQKPDQSSAGESSHTTWYVSKPLQIMHLACMKNQSNHYHDASQAQS